MPPKPKPNVKTVKNKKPVQSNNDVKEQPANAETSNCLSPEAEDQLELELCWCIQQLELSLASGKLPEKQAFCVNKSLNVLKSNTAPIIKKRQVMRNTLGDYRVKMAEDEQKLKKSVASVKFTSPSTANRKSVFVKKAHIQSSQAVEKESRTDQSTESQNLVDNHNENITEVQVPFRFNFQSVE